MEAEILEKPPTSWFYEEHLFGNSMDLIWVKFLDDNYIEWVGAFDIWWRSPTNMIIQWKNKNLFVIIAWWQGYFVDTNKRKIILKTQKNDITNIIYNEYTKLFVLTNGLSLTVFDGSNEIWSSERISADGIAFNKQEWPIVKWILDDLSKNGCLFTFNVSTKELKNQWVLKDNFPV